MPFASRLVHTLEVRRWTDTGAVDDYGQPVRTEELVTATNGLPQPRQLDEVMQVNQAGAVYGDWVIYLPVLPIREADHITHEAAECPRDPDLPDAVWEIRSVPDAAGLSHHYEVGATLVESETVDEGDIDSGGSGGSGS